MSKRQVTKRQEEEYEKEEDSQLELDDVTIRERSVVTLSILRTETTTEVQSAENQLAEELASIDNHQEGLADIESDASSPDSDEAQQEEEKKEEEEEGERGTRRSRAHGHNLEMSYQPQVITRTKQDLVNSGDFFRMNEKFAAEEQSNGASHNKHNKEQLVNSSHSTNYKNLQANSTTAANKTPHKTFSDCCYSLANLGLIFASVIALMALVRFLQDDPLYDYGEYLLTLRFYRQLVFVVVILPLILLIPIFNAMNLIISLTSSKTASNFDNISPATKTSLLRIKLVYQLLMFLLALLCLIFLVPYVKSSTLESQLKLELTKFMKTRYDSEFSYQLLDRIQEEYECCDELWYRANLRDHLPLSCFAPNSNYGVMYGQTCSEALGTLVGTRCGIIAICLLVLLISLASLFAIDLSESLTLAQGRAYDVSSASSSAAMVPQSTFTTSPKVARSVSVNKTAANGRVSGDLPKPYHHTSDKLDKTLGARFKFEDRELPLLLANQNNDHDEQDLERDELDAGHHSDSNSRTNHTTAFSNSRRPHRAHKRDEGQSQSNDSPSKSPPNLPDAPPVLLTRANYQMVRHDRSQSPVFVSGKPKDELDRSSASANQKQDQSQKTPIKSALKKTASNQNVMLDEDASSLARPQRFSYFNDDQDDSLDDEDEYTGRLRQSDSLLRQKQFQREQTRRSLLSVRFADDQSTFD